MPNPTPNDEIIFAFHYSLALGTPVLIRASFPTVESSLVETNPSLLAGHTQYNTMYHVCMYFLYVCTYPRRPYITYICTVMR